MKTDYIRAVTIFISVCIISFSDAAPVSIANSGFKVHAMPDNSPIQENTFRVDPGTPSDWDPYDPNTILNRDSRSIGLINPTNSTFFRAEREGFLAAENMLRCQFCLRASEFA